MLTIVGLVASAGTLFIASQLGDVSIWAMNFALMFALALGIDYALFIVHRYRAALFGARLDPVDAVAVTMDTAGKAVLFSGATVLISLSAVMLVPSPAFQSMALGIMISVFFILLATLTLLPAVLAKLGPKVDRAALKWVALRRAPLEGVRQLGGATLAPSDRVRARFAGDPRRACDPDLRPEDRHAVDQGRPGRGLLPAGLRARPAGVWAGRARAAPDRRPEGRRCPCHGDAEGRPWHRPRHAGADLRAPRARRGGAERRPVRTRRSAARSTGSARRFRPGCSSAAPQPRTTTSSRRSPRARRSVIGLVLGLGFLLLLIALQAPVIAAVGVAHQPARRRRRVRSRSADLPERPRLPACSASSRRASSTPGPPSSSSR